MRSLISKRSVFAPLVAASMIALLCFSIGCERSPEDLEEWRNAQDGMTQLAQWASSEDEPDEVRVRALQIMVEEDAASRIPRALDEIEDEQKRTELADGTITTIEEMWQEQDFPELTDEMREEGAQVAVEQSDAVRAVDAIYDLMDYFGDDARQRARQIVRDWISEDQELRTQIADTGIPYLVQYAGDDGTELIRDWIIETHDPRDLAGTLRRHGPENAGSTVDDAIAERAQKQHPDLDDSLKHAVAGAETDSILPYLEEAIHDDATDDQFRQVAIDTAAEVGDGGIDLLTTLIQEETHPLRWAAANSIVDAKGTAGLVDIGNALPDDPDAYDTPDDDSFHGYVSQICTYIGTQAERGNIDGDTEPVAELLATDHWPAQTLGLRCAGSLEAADLRDDIQALEDQSFDLPAWGQPQTVGDFASTVDGVLAEAEDK